MKYLIFDLDDTLLSSSAGYDLALKECGIDSEHFKHARQCVKDRLPDRHTSARNRWLYFKEYLESQGNFSSDRLIELISKYENSLHSFQLKKWDESGKKNLLKRLKDRGYILNVITNETVQSQVKKLKIIDPDGTIFTDFLCSEEVGVEKPDLKIFNEMARRLNSPTKILFVGDDVVNDLLPARSIGWEAILTTEYRHTQNEFGFREVSDLLQLEEVLK